MRLMYTFVQKMDTRFAQTRSSHYTRRVRCIVVVVYSIHYTDFVSGDPKTKTLSRTIYVHIL